MSAPLELLLADGVIDEVLGRLKSGKEADISLVMQRGQLLAAKVYKDRATRSFKNNADYKEGRKTRNSRTQRAMDSGGQFGRDAAEQAWKSAESAALTTLIAHGVRVPRPVMFYEGVLLMELVLGEDGRPAARLIDVALDAAAAAAVYADLRSQIITMLCCDLIHGDLSPYNILAGATGPTIIDFPQVVSAAHSSRAQFFFQRDFDNVLRYVAGADPALARHASDAQAIWRAYTGRFLTRGFVPPPPRPIPPPRPAPVRRPEPRFAPRDDRRPAPRLDQRSAPPRSDQRSDQRSAGPRDDRRPPPHVDQRPALRSDQRPALRSDQRPDQRSDQRPAPRSDQRPDQRSDQRPAPRSDQRPDQRSDQRSDQRPAPRSDQRPAPRSDQRLDPRSAPRSDQRPALRSDQRSAPRPDLRAEPRPDLRAEPRPELHPTARPDPRDTPRVVRHPSSATPRVVRQQAAAPPPPRPERPAPGAGGRRRPRRR